MKIIDKIKKGKKAQEEVFGFVIIVLIVMIIGLVFFAFSLRRPSEIIEPKQAELDDLLQAMLSYTTNCEISNSNQSIRELIRECNNNPSRVCNNQQVCEYLETELTNMLEEFLGQNMANSYVHAYTLNITTQEPINIANGELKGNFFGSSISIPNLGGQDITIKLRFYYSKE